MYWGIIREVLFGLFIIAALVIEMLITDSIGLILITGIGCFLCLGYTIEAIKGEIIYKDLK
jgi:hypothetical protein